MAERRIQLNAVLATEKSVRQHAEKTLAEVHKICQKGALFTGMTRVFEKTSEDSPDMPPERVLVQHTVKDVNRLVATLMATALDATATKDYGNALARADVVINGKVLIKDAPTPYLLFLEKKLQDILTYVRALPTLDPAHLWALDENAGHYVAESERVNRTAKTQRGIVLYNATPEHPAQTQLITEDVTIGTWVTTPQSGAIPLPLRDRLIDRVMRLQNAVKTAREYANTLEVAPQEVGETLMNYIFDN